MRFLTKFTDWTFLLAFTECRDAGKLAEPKAKSFFTLLEKQRLLI